MITFKLSHPCPEFIWVVAGEFIFAGKRHRRCFTVRACDPNEAVQDFKRRYIYKEFPAIEGFKIKIVKLSRKTEVIK